MRKVQFWAVLGFVIAIASTTVFDSSFSQKGAMNASVTGLVLVFAAGLEIVGLHRLMDATLTGLGAWLVAAPFVLPYEGPVAFAHIVLGALLVMIGAVQRLVNPKPPIKS